MFFGFVSAKKIFTRNVYLFKIFERFKDHFCPAGEKGVWFKCTNSSHWAFQIAQINDFSYAGKKESVQTLARFLNVSLYGLAKRKLLCFVIPRIFYSTMTTKTL